MYFEKAFEIVLMHEGGYSNHPSDRGGKTKYGVTEKVARASGYSGQMKDLHLSVAKKIYKQHFWDSIRIDEIRSQEICIELFDSAVNMGSGTAIKMLQESLNNLNRNEHYYSDLVIDGLIGSKTIKATNFLIDKKFTMSLLKSLNGEQYIRYKKIIKSNPDQEVFFRGWLKRIW